MSEAQTEPVGSAIDGLAARAKRITIYETARLIFVLGGAWVSFWMYGGDFITARADDILVEALKRKGMGPADIKLIQDRLISLGLDLDASRVSIGHLNTEIDGIQDKLSRIDENQKSITETQRQTYDLLKTLIPLMKAEIGDRRP